MLSRYRNRLQQLRLVLAQQVGARVVALSGPRKLVLKVAYDVAVVAVCLSATLAMDPRQATVGAATFLAMTAVMSGVVVAVNFLRSLYSPISFSRDGDILLAASASAIAASATFWAFAALPQVAWSLSASIVLAALTLAGVGGARVWMRALLCDQRSVTRERLVIYGAGEAGRQFLAAVQQRGNYEAIAFIDDNAALHGTRIGGIRVFPADEVEQVVQRVSADTVLLAIPSATMERRRQILRRLENLTQVVRTVPDLEDIVAGGALISQVRSIVPEDLLGRDIVPPSEALISTIVTNKIVMVTGAGGSIGSELCSQILKRKPARLVVLDHSEFALYNLTQKLSQLAGSKSEIIEAHLASVTDPDRLSEIFAGIDVDLVLHAAAYKHVPIVEQNAVDAVRNNAIGTLRLAQAAMRAGVDRFVLVSTDKAVEPSSVMGASKRLSELACYALSATQTETKFACVRFGNVLDSSGSVAPLFRDQIERGGPVTVTDPNVTRYFMTSSEASQLVLHAAAMTDGFDVYVLGMGQPVRIIDLATRMIRLSGRRAVLPGDGAAGPGDIEIVYTGLRPGEKLHEKLYSGSSIVGTEHSRIQRDVIEKPELSELNGLIARLEAACRRRDKAMLKEVLRHRLVALSSPAAGGAEIGNGLEDRR